MTSLRSPAVRSRWIACFSLAVFQTLVGLTIIGLAIAHVALSNLVVTGGVPNIDACHDSTLAAVLQGLTLVVAGSMGITAYAPFLSESAEGQPKMVFIAIHVLFSAVVAFVGYNAAATHGCIALGKGAEKEIFGIVVSRVVLSYICHIIGGLCAGLALPDICRGLLKSRGSHHNETESKVRQVLNRINSKTIETEDKRVTVITLPESEDGSTIYAVPQNQFVVQKKDGSVPTLPRETIAEEKDDTDEAAKLV